MVTCMNCGALLGDDVEICPLCGVNQLLAAETKVNIPVKEPIHPLPGAAQESTQDTTAHDEAGTERSQNTSRLIQRGDECYNRGKSWLRMGDRNRARKEFQRAFNYYETVLKLDPGNKTAREARNKCLSKIAR